MKRFLPFLCIIILTFSCEEETVSPCAGVVCKNDGVCRNGACQCSPRYKGEFCETLNEGTVTFVNNSQTAITINANGEQSQIAKGGNLVVAEIIGESVTFTAETSGKNASGNLIGLKLVWSSISYEVTNTPRTVPLDISSEFFFLNVKNNSASNIFQGLYVNFGLNSQTFDNNFSLPADGIIYPIGYYRAFTNTKVRMNIFNKPSFYEWTHGSNFTFPFTKNQIITVTGI